MLDIGGTEKARILATVLTKALVGDGTAPRQHVENRYETLQICLPWSTTAVLPRRNLISTAKLAVKPNYRM